MKTENIYLIQLRKLTVKTFLIFITAVTSLFTLADDTEIYRNDNAAGVQPNVLFVFDTSGSMGFLPNSDTNAQSYEDSRMDIVKQAAIDVIGDPDIRDINIGIMRFDKVESEVYPIDDVKYYKGNTGNVENYRDGGGYVLAPISDINDDDHRNSILAEITKLDNKGGTPLVETYSEAINYMRGDDVVFGKKYGKTEYQEGGTVTIPIPERTEDIIECQECSVGWNLSGECKKWRLFSGTTLGTITTVNEDRCDRWWDNDYKLVVTGTKIIPASSYTEERSAGFNQTAQKQYFYMSHPDSYDKDTGKYISPITNSCQKNHIFVFTDGVSSLDNEADTAIRSKFNTLDESIDTNQAGISSNCATNGGGNDNVSTNSCMEELSLFAFETDNAVDSTLLEDSDPTTESKQSITTHTIGGFLNDDSKSVAEILKKAADYSDGLYVEASDSETLKAEIKRLFAEVELDTKIGTSSPAVTVNAMNRLESAEELYYTVFEPRTTKGWSGNLKRYKLGSDGSVLDKNDEPAVDPDTGYFSDTSTSIWTEDADAPDGKDVKVGGAASHLTTDRNVFTYAGGTDKLIDDVLIETTDGLLDVVNFVLPSYISQDILGSGLPDDTFKTMLKWASGIDVDENGNDIARQAIEDPLHSDPIIISYKENTSTNQTLFFGTNSGYLHAFNLATDTPTERFAYIPYELLPNIEVYFNQSNEYGKTYGLDGPLTSLIYNSDKVDAGLAEYKTFVNSGPKEKANIYAGMRRGGETYYSLDVSDPDAPKHLWQISSTDTGFEELGETWSEMKPIYVNPKAIGVTGTKGSKATIPVVVFGGGYDTKEDDTSESSRINHTEGNAIFIVDALDGTLLWKASSTVGANLVLPEMKNSIVSDIKPVDNDGDGDIDILYASDTGGRLWRIDLFSDGTQSGVVLADLNGGNIEDNTRFFTSPTVAFHTYPEVGSPTGKKDQYVITLGSGYRAHPLVKNNQDRLFVVFDSITYLDEATNKSSLSSYSTKKLNNFADFGNLDAASSDAKENGFYIKLPNTGEKALTDAIIADNTVYVATYSPVVLASSVNIASCNAASGSSNLYSIDLKNYNPQDENLGVVVQTTQLAQTGIPAEPKIVFPPEDTSSDDDDDSNNDDEDDADEDCSTMAILIGSESIALDKCTSVGKSYWREL